jgi:3-methylcrotonyl-CoA carboxylase alpha subunit
MGDKPRARRIMEKAGVSVLPGSPEALADVREVRQVAASIGYPVLVKAAAGGGGRGMRIAVHPDDLDRAFQTARSEGELAFGNNQVYVERYLERARHIEVQVLGDRHRHLVHLGERDCSIQRRHQKVIEEAPAPGLSDDTRKRMGAAAVAAAEAVGYVGAGTVEFLYADGQFYFIEMNTRLQVEHPVTEMIAGIDLVEWQLRVASGEPLPEKQAELQRYGHAMEVRLYAEDPTKGFLPAIGRIAHLAWPTNLSNMRIDSGVRAGDRISTYYDPMIAKVIAWGADRVTAAQRLRRALQETEIAGLATNTGFLVEVLGHPAFLKEEIDTGFIERHRADLLPEGDATPDRVLALCAAFAILKDGAVAKAKARAGADPHSPWAETNGWRVNGEGGSSVLLRDAAGKRRDVRIGFAGGCWSFSIDTGAPINLLRPALDQNILSAATQHSRLRLTAIEADGIVTLIDRGKSWRIGRVDVLAEAEAATEGTGHLTSPMPGTVVRVMAAAGDQVKRGQPLLVVEAMKMEHTIAAHTNGVVKQVKFKAGDSVAEGVELISFEAAT